MRSGPARSAYHDDIFLVAAPTQLCERPARHGADLEGLLQEDFEEL